jgi:hypothetical protein
VLRRRALRSSVVLVALAIGGFALATSLFAPAKLHNVGNAVTSIAPALGGTDAGTSATSANPTPRPTSTSATPRATNAPPAPRPAPATRSKGAPRARSAH